MNIVKFRPVGSPKGRVVRVRVTQSKRAIYPVKGQRPGLTVAMANRLMLAKGFVRVNGGAL